MDAGDDLDQGRLTGAVLADQRMNFARRELQRNVVERGNTREPLADVLNGEARRSCSRRAHRAPSIEPDGYEY
jgi:hypothetical protein